MTRPTRIPTYKRRYGFKGYWPQLVDKINAMRSDDFLKAKNLNEAEKAYSYSLATLGYLEKHNYPDGTRFKKLASVPTGMTSSALMERVNLEKNYDIYNRDENESRN